MTKHVSAIASEKPLIVIIQFCLGLCLQFHLYLCTSTYCHYFLEYDIILSIRFTSVLAVVTVIKRQKVNACGISPVIL